MIGMPTGAGSGRWVVDIDVNNKPGLASLAALEQQHGKLPPTLTARTPSGGQHRYFRWNGVDIRNSEGQIADGIDVRADGGYVIVPPSINTNGMTYTWDST
jgi:hypothetical protein